MSNLNQFHKNITTILARPINFTLKDAYLDLADLSDYKTALHKEEIDTAPLDNPLIDATSLIVKSMKSCHLTHTKLGINELLKSFLCNIDSDNQEKCAEMYSDFLYELFLYCIQDVFPYTDLLWNYLGNCFHTVSLILVEKGYVNACDILLKKISIMGKVAAQKGLHTSNIQHFLYTLEVRASELNYTDIASLAENYRFNLES